MAGVHIRSTDMISEYQHALFNISVPDIARRKVGHVHFLACVAYIEHARVLLIGHFDDINTNIYIKSIIYASYLQKNTFWILAHGEEMCEPFDRCNSFPFDRIEK